jgi:carboxyl-terminal processing protease
MEFTKQDRDCPSSTGVRTGASPTSVARAAAIVLLSFLVLNSLLTRTLVTAQNEKEETEQDFPLLFRAVANLLQLHYLDLDRVNPRPLMEKAFFALEDAVDEIYVENSDPSNPYVAVNVESKKQVYNLEEVRTLDDSVRMLENVFDFLKRNYRGQTSLNEIRYAAENGFLSGLDPHTIVFSPEAFKDFSVHIEGEIYGVGMLVGARDGKLTVIEVLKDTPAFKAGFKKGDLLTKIGDESTINMTVPEAVDKIRGPLKSVVTITVKRAKADKPNELEALVIPVERNRVVIKSVESKLIPDWNKDSAGPWKGGVGYVQVKNFDKNTTPSLWEHLQKLKSENGGPLAGLILDLRGNSGGLLTQAVDMSDLFLKSGTIVITASRGDRFIYQEAKNDGTEPEYPIAVLASESSASGAEIVVGALQKNDRAIVLGTRTFGKGSVQQLHHLPNDAQLKITVSEYLLPGKVSIQENGVVPNIQGQPVVLGGGESGMVDAGEAPAEAMPGLEPLLLFDLFPNESSLTEKDYERHIVSRFAKKETPSYTLHYLFEPPKEDLYSDPFMSGDLEPQKDKLVQMALSILKLSGSPFKASEIVRDHKSEIEKLREQLFEEIVLKLKQKGIDWSQDPSAQPVGEGKLELELAHEFIKEPSPDKEDPVPINKVLIKARLTNKGDKPAFRIKGLSLSDYFLYKDQEFLFGKVDPGQTVERSAKIRVPYFPFARSDVFTVEVSSTADPSSTWDRSTDKVLVSKSMEIELKDSGHPAFAYSADLMSAGDRKPIASLKTPSEALMKLRIKNVGTAPAYKGIAILRNETGRQVFLKEGKGRIEFQNLASRGETEVEFEFEVREGEPVEHYDFELAVVDSYSGATLARKLVIPRRDKEDAKPFPNGVYYAPPEVSAAVVDPETKTPVVVTRKDALSLEALVKSQDSDPFKTWIFNSVSGDRQLPDKVFFADSRGEPKLEFSTSVSLKKGTNFLTVVSSDKDGLESRQNIIVRRE